MRLCLWAFLALLLGAPPAAASSAYDIEKVTQAMRSTPKDLVLLTPHRGLWEYVPENSIPAVQRALDNDYESIEIDVRLNGSGHAWLMHDFNLDRLTDGHGPLAAYSDRTLSTIRLRDRYGNVTGENIVSLRKFLDFYAFYMRNISRFKLRGAVLVIDLKSPPGGDPKFDEISAYQALIKSYNLVRLVGVENQIDLQKAVVFKLKAKETPTIEKLAKDLDYPRCGDFYFMPVMHPDDAGNGNRVINEYMDSCYAIGFEAVKEYNGQQPAEDWIARLKSAGRTVPGFPGWNDYPEGVAFSSGICCLNRNTDPDKESKEKREPLDYSGSFEYQLQIGANWITADTVEFLNEYLAKRGLRNLDQLR